MNAHLKGHLCIGGACIIWGLMSPLGKDAMLHGIAGFDMVTFRVLGACICFWAASLITRAVRKARHQAPLREPSRRDLLLFFGVAVFSVICNQCCFTVGLSYTSPTNASIMTTTLPIITMILAAIVLKEPVTPKKVLGITAGISGALLLILSSAQSKAPTEGHLLGDILVIGAQCSFAIYLTYFKHLVQRYNPVTVMKWTFTYATLVILPFNMHHLASLPWACISTRTWAETAFVVFCGTFVAYIMMMKAQQVLRPTVVSIYNYLQPTVACLVSVLTGLGVFGLYQGIAVVLVFTGVYLVTVAGNHGTDGH